MPVSVAILTISLVGCPILSMEMIHRGLDQPHYGWNDFAMDELCIPWGGHSHLKKSLPSELNQLPPFSEAKWTRSYPFPRLSPKPLTRMMAISGTWKRTGELKKAVSGAIFWCQEKGEFCMEWHGLWEFLRGILVGASWTCVFGCFQATWFLEDWRRVCF